MSGEYSQSQSMHPVTEGAQTSAAHNLQIGALSPDQRAAVDDQVERFITALLSEDLQSDSFRQRLDSAFALGREEISLASSLMQGRLLQQNFVGVEDSPAFHAIQSMRDQLDALNPGRQGDLLQTRRLLGLIPFGSKLQHYFRRFQSASQQLNTAMHQLYSARDDMQRDLIEIEATRVRLWEAIQKLKAATQFAETLDLRLAQKVEVLQATDADRAQAMEQEVLFPVRQNLQDMLTQHAVCVNGYLALELLKKTAREMINGCTRVATTGISALATAQTVARATGNQLQVMDMLSSVNDSIETMIAESGRQLGAHVERTAKFAERPMIGIERLQQMFEQTFAAMDALDEVRHSALQAMQQNNAAIREQLLRADRYVERQQRLQRGLDKQLDLAGPVAL